MSAEFALNVARLDRMDNHGWKQQLGLYYLVITDVDACNARAAAGAKDADDAHGHTGKTLSAGPSPAAVHRRCGVAKVGPSHAWRSPAKERDKRRQLAHVSGEDTSNVHHRLITGDVSDRLLCVFSALPGALRCRSSGYSADPGAAAGTL